MGWLTKHRHLGKSPLASSLGFFVLLGAIILITLHVRSVNVWEKIELAYTFYFEPPPQQQVAPVVGDKAYVPAIVEQPPTPEQASSHTQRVVHGEKTTGIPRIALHTLSDSQYRQNRADGPEMAELLTSLLMSEVGKSEGFELLDRSLLPALFAEKSLLLANDRWRSGQADMEKLPISDFTLVGSLFSSDTGNAYSLKLVSNSTGQVLGASRFHFTLDTIDTSIQEARAFVQNAVIDARSFVNSEEKNKIAFGHFIDISKTDTQINQGRDITERLIARYVNERGYSVWSRTQTFPLLFEEYLRFLQYTDEHQESMRRDVRYLVYGKYRINEANSKYPLSIYLYIDTIRHGRELTVLHVENWDMAYEQINNAIAKFIPDPGWQISAENRQVSRKLFLNALRARGMLHSEKILTGKLPPRANDIQSFSSTYKAENLASAREYIDRSLELDPHNQLSRMALAMHLETEGNIEASTRLLNEAKRSQDVSTAEMAYQILSQRYRPTISAQDFEPIVGSGNAKNILNKLLEKKYLIKVGERIVFNARHKSDQVFNRPHDIFIAGIDHDTSVQVFEKLRSLYYKPGTQIRYQKPRRFHPRDAHKKREWHQTTYRDKYNIEAILHFDIARTASNIYINDATALPTVEYYEEAAQESTERRLSNTEVAVDGFSSSIYLDTSYLKSKVLLGHSLCQEGTGQCTLGQMIHSWVVDHTLAANLKGRGGIYFNVTEDVVEKDRLIFLAADAVDRVAEASLSDMFEYTLVQEEYFVKKYQEKLTALLQKVGTPVPEQAIDRVVDAYAGLILAHCVQLNRHKRDLRYPAKYATSMDAVARLAQQDDRVASLLKTRLAEIRVDYPAVYPYLLVRTRVRNPFIVELQGEVIRRVAIGEIIPYEPEEFMEIALQLFKALVDSQDNGRARQYIQYFADYYGIKDKTAMDFAYMYYRVGDAATSDKLLQDYGKTSFNISKFSIPNVDGVYAHKGFDERGQLRFTNRNSANIHIVFRALKSHIGLGEQPAKWSLYINRKSHSGNRNGKHSELFAFGNGGRLTGEMLWAAQGSAKVDMQEKAGLQTEGVPEADGESILEVVALSKNELGRAENTIERLFNEDYAVSASQRSAIKGYSKRPTVGPLLDSYFPDSFSRNRKISVVKEELFEKGYLTVSGIPLLSSRSALYSRLEKDFPDYSEFEKRSLQKAFAAAMKVSGAGYVEIHEDNGGSWSLASTLVSEDAVENRHFGMAVAIHEEHALIPDDYLARKGKRQRFTYFGSSLAILDDTILIGNPYGGVGHKGEVYVFTLNDYKWQQSNILLQGKTAGGFGASITVDKNYLAIGNPSNGEVDTPVFHSGSVFVYAREKSGWKLKVHLVPRDRPKNASFGRRVLLKGDKKTTLLVKSAKDVYRYDLPPIPFEVSMKF